MLRFVLTACLAASAASCTSEGVAPLEEPSLDGTYFGSVSGSDAVLAITVDGDVAVAYVCGGPDSLESATRWYRGEVKEGVATLEALSGQTLEVTFDASGATGSFVDWKGTSFSFDVVAESESQFHGLYMVIDSGCRTGVVVKKGSDGEELVQGAWCNDLGIFEQVTPVTPIEIGAEQLIVEVSGEDAKTLTVVAVDPNAF